FGPAQLVKAVRGSCCSAQRRGVPREQEFAAKVAAAGSGVAIKDATGVFGNLRRVKSQREIDILQHAADITAEAFRAPTPWPSPEPGNTKSKPNSNSLSCAAMRTGVIPASSAPASMPPRSTTKPIKLRCAMA